MNTKQPSKNILRIVLMGATTLLIMVVSSLGLLDGFTDSYLSFQLEFFRPLQELDGKLGTLGKHLSNLQNLAAENQRLANEVLDLSQELAQLNSATDLSKKLKKQQGYLSKKLINLVVPATLVRRDYPSIGTLAMIAAEEVEVGDYALAYGYVVGKVSALTEQFVYVELLNSSNSRIPVYIGTEHNVGELSAEVGVGLLVSNLDSQAKVSVGAQIKLFEPQYQILKELPLGHVTETIAYDADPTKVALVSTPIDLGGIDTLMILRNGEK